MTFLKQDRQRIIDDYLTQSGANMYVPAAFVAWLENKPDHEAYEWFFGRGDAELAHERRIQMAREMQRGLRIQIVSNETRSKFSGKVEVRDYPAFVSPSANRTKGGGYVGFDPDSEEHRRELVLQGFTALSSWLERYGGVFADAQISTAGIQRVVIAAQSFCDTDELAEEVA